MKAFDDVELGCVRLAAHSEPEPVIKPDRIHHQSVAVPVADGIPVPEILHLKMFSSIQKDLAESMNITFEQHQDQFWSLDKFSVVGSAARNSAGYAARFRILSGIILHAFFGNLS